MPTPKASLITHPMRARILVALMGRRLTTRQIAELLPDVPRASLYRHVRELLHHGVLIVVDQKPVRGTLESLYAVRPEGGHLAPADVEGASQAEQLQYFTTFVEAISGVFRDYLARVNAEARFADITLRAEPIYLTDDEFAGFKSAIEAMMEPFRRNEPGQGRRRRIVATIVIPEAPEPPEA